MSFADNVVIVTGASSGIGREMARQLAVEGARVVLAARDQERLEELASNCGGATLVHPTDVADEAACAALVEATVEKWGRIDTLVCNAGISMWARFDELPDCRPVEKIMQVNYLGSVYCTFHALSHLKQSKGRIVGVSSVTGKTGVPTRTAYAASKHAMAGFYDSLRIELADTGVSVTMAYPDFVATEVRERAVGPGGEPLGESPVEEGKVMSAEECARLILDAARDRKRELVMSSRARAGLWLKLIAPSVVDGIARRAIEKKR